MVRRMLKKDVLYFMVVNLPSEEEIRLGREIIEGEEAEGNCDYMLVWTLEL